MERIGFRCDIVWTLDSGFGERVRVIDEKSRLIEKRISRDHAEVEHNIDLCYDGPS